MALYKIIKALQGKSLQSLNNKKSLYSYLTIAGM